MLRDLHNVERNPLPLLWRIMMTEDRNDPVKRKRVLVVDDNIELALMYQTIIDRLLEKLEMVLGPRAEPLT